MLTADRAAAELALYTQRIEELYAAVRGWAVDRFPDATFTYGTADGNEESIGRYTVRTMDVHVPGRRPLRLRPIALFNLGARGQVRVSGWFGSESLMWVTGDGANDPGAEPDEEEMLVSRPAFADVPRGWTWLDNRHVTVRPLTGTVFWDHAAHDPEWRRFPIHV